MYYIDKKKLKKEINTIENMRDDFSAIGNKVGVTSTTSSIFTLEAIYNSLTIK